MITFRSLKFNRNQSRETEAYTATVLWKGTVIGHIRNCGSGGMSIFEQAGPEVRPLVEEATEFAKTQPFLPDSDDDSKHKFLEDYIDDVANVEGHRATVTAWFKRNTRDRIVLIEAGEVRRSAKLKPTTNRAQASKEIASRRPTAKILNDLPAEEAVNLLLACKGFSYD